MHVRSQANIFVIMQMLLDPLKRLKKADAHVNVTQGALAGVGM